MDEKAITDDIRRELVALLPQLRRFAMTLARDTSSADELVGAACEKAVQKPHMRKKDRRLEVWLFAIIHGLWSDEQKKRRATQQGRIEKSQRHKTPSDAHSAYSILDGLNAELAPAFLLCAVERLSYSEASDVLSLPQEVVAARMATARAELAELFNRSVERRA